MNLCCAMPMPLVEMVWATRSARLECAGVESGRVVAPVYQQVAWKLEFLVVLGVMLWLNAERAGLCAFDPKIISDIALNAF